MLILGRRAFIGHAAALAASAAGVWSLAHQTAATRLVVTHVHPAEEIMDEVLWGIRLGVDEAQHSDAMFGGSVELRDLQLPMCVAPAAAMFSGSDNALHVVIPGLMSPEFFDAIMGAARTAGALVLNGSRRDPTAYLRCRRHVFHVRPSPSTFGEARASLPASVGGEMATWSRDLTRFGADTLNKRFRAFASRAMDSSSWCGWFAVKCAWEAALQSQATTSEQLGATLAKASTRFDGHKGTALYFDSNHELVQPLYLLNGQDVIGETEPVKSRGGVACD